MTNVLLLFETNNKISLDFVQYTDWFLRVYISLYFEKKAINSNLFFALHMKGNTCFVGNMQLLETKYFSSTSL